MIRLVLFISDMVREKLFAKFFNPRLDLDVVAILKQLKDNARVVCGTNTFESPLRLSYAWWLL